jgi:hypothetical protein
VSVTPLLNAQTQTSDALAGQLRASDIRGTSQREAVNLQETDEADADDQRKASGNVSGSGVHQPQVTGRTDAPRPITFSYGADKAQPLPPAISDSYATDHAVSVVPAASPKSGTASKSSIVFVRSANPTPASADTRVPVSDPPADLLPPGSRIIVRLESAVTSALKAPVVAAVEYNYEKDGAILIPAGAKVIGDLQQASSDGSVGIRFHTLQMPNGRSEQIEAIAMDLQNKPIKGAVTGANKGKKFFVRALSGVGTVASYVVGGSSLGQPISGGTLLRDRIAGNIATAGDQELTNAAISQNIVVTVPAQTRLYVVFQKPAVQRTAVEGSKTIIEPGNRPPIPTAQELRELMELRQEIYRMYSEPANTKVEP